MSESNAESRPDIKSSQLKEQPTAVVRETVPMNALRDFFSRAFGAVMGAVQQQHVQLAGPPFALYRGMPTDVVDVEAGFPLAAPFTPAGGGDTGVSAGSLPSGHAYEAMHIGPYEKLQQTYGAIQARMQADGVTPGEAMWEYYLSDPAAEPDPSKWKTLVVWPVA
ncbi:AraC family transcriptional regulator [Arthrobacter sp. PAMC25564]|uniref:GyrI-like domain-containing protein n=1 Tax=Arthrobacter sp. PAMC25564 TaxID=2565366 RepID=UPI0010A2A400|nr:GyrI-like domain-containing protein [Arthrobacter sp. PAMC25564]QCB98733.1 AraC family transcriptional regulator [Arthrobacter sp. PAMC25564]